MKEYKIIKEGQLYRISRNDGYRLVAGASKDIRETMQRMINLARHYKAAGYKVNYNFKAGLNSWLSVN